MLSRIFVLLLSLLALLAVELPAQASDLPTEEQIRKDLAAPGVIEIIIRGKGTLERLEENNAWVDEYYRSVTVRRETDKPGVTVDVKGDAVYRLVNGHFVFRKLRLGGNTYGGIANPTLAEINALVRTLNPPDIDRMFSLMVGEMESIRLAAEPRWEWHSPKSVSFDVVQVYSLVYNGGSYDGISQELPSPGKAFVDRVQRIERWRIYRDSESGPWVRLSASGHRVGTMIPIKGGPSLRAVSLLGRTATTPAAAQSMPRPTRVPLLTE